MKKIAILSVFLSFSGSTISQTFEWVRHNPVNYNFNPSYGSFSVCYDQANNRVIHARLDSFAYIYSVSILGKTVVESRDTNGFSLWAFPLGNAATIDRIVVDQSGDIIVGGHFQETLHIGTNDSLVSILTPFSAFNFFLIKLNSQGNLIWKRNLTATWPDYSEVHALAIAPSGVCWYATTDFFIAKIVSIDSNGNDVIVYNVENAKTIGSISFDPSGGMYISGGAQIGNFIMDTDTFYAPNDYNMFIARYNPFGQPSWAYFGNDVTFQRPVTTTDLAGNVFFAGMRFDTLSFNGTFIHAPQFSGDFFVFKADSICNLQWVVKQPPLLMGPFGSFEPGQNLCIDTDVSGNLYMGGVQNGLVDWGNGYTSSTAGFSDRKSAVAKISASGNTEWVKIGGSPHGNYLHALAVSEQGSCYFTGSFSDTAFFDNNFIPTTTFYNFMLGKLVDLSTDLPEVISGSKFQIFPNPASDVIYLKGMVSGSAIKIIDMTGRIVRWENINGDGVINISSLAPGSYLLYGTDESVHGPERFIKR